MIKVGDKFLTNKYGEVEVVEYKSFHEIVVVFSCGTEKIVSGGNLRKGEVSPKRNKNVISVNRYLGRNDVFKQYTILQETSFDVKFCCNSCDKLLGVEGYIFTSPRESFKSGNVSCGCSKRLNFSNDIIVSKILENVLKDRGIYLSNYVDKFNKRKIRWKCHEGHLNSSNYSDLRFKNSGCPLCTRSVKNIIYLVKLVCDKGIYTKIGITNNMKRRIKCYEEEGLKTKDLYFFETESIGISNSEIIENSILKLSRYFNITDPYSLEGYTGYTEIFKEDDYDNLKRILETIRKEGDFNAYQEVDFFIRGRL